MYRVACFSGVLLMLASSASAVMVYAPNGVSRPYPFSGPDELVRFDASNPRSFETVGSMNVPNIGCGGMECDADGGLWAYASFYKSTGGAAAGLYRVDTTTGAATLQGTASTQPLDDLAFNPVDGKMYGVRSQYNATRLYTVNLVTGATSLVGYFSGLPTDVHRVVGMAIDSTGAFYLNDVGVDKIYKGTGLALMELYSLPQDTNFSQGLAIDWSRDDTGYHGAVGQGEFPNYFAQINTFATDGSAYTLGPDFGPNEMIEGYGYPLVQPNDLAIVPIPEPGALLLLAVGMLFCGRRR